MKIRHGGVDARSTPLQQMEFRACALAALLLAAALTGCTTGHYTPLDDAEATEIEQLKENQYRVEYQVSAFTSQAQLDSYLRRHCAELALREGYDFFQMAQRSEVLGLSRRTAMTITMYKGLTPAGVADLYNAKNVLAGPASASRTN